MNIKDIRRTVERHIRKNDLNLTWDGDNRYYVVERLLPIMPLRPEVRQIIRWAYGYDGTDRSYEKDSDGSSIVPDVFLQGKIKEPYGVGHDWICSLRRESRTDPVGHIWKWREGIKWYFMALQDFGYPIRAWERRIGLYSFSWWYWFVRPGVE